MHNSVLGVPARRSIAAVAAASALAAAALALAPNAQATTGSPGGTRSGRAGAAVLRAGLDVSLLERAAVVPLDVTLDDVHAPGDAGGTALTARLDGVGGGRPFSVLRADVATARATADGHRAQGYANLVDARVTLPGLFVPLLTVTTATSRATCDAGRRPTATSDVLGTVDVLGRPVTLTAGGVTDVRVPGVGRVRLTLSRTATTSTTAAATALDLTVAVNPLGLGVAAVKGDVSLVEASCTAPGGHGGGSTGGSGNGGTGSGGSGSGGSASGGSGSGGSGSGGSGGGGSATGGGANGGSTGGSSASGGSGSSGGTSGSSSGSTASGGASGSGGSGTGASSGSGASGSGGSSGQPPTVTTTGQGLADTGASPAFPLLAAGAVALLIAGGTVFHVARRRRPGRSG